MKRNVLRFVTLLLALGLSSSKATATPFNSLFGYFEDSGFIDVLDGLEDQGAGPLRITHDEGEVAVNIDWLGSVTNCGAPGFGNKWMHMPYKWTCLFEAGPESECYWNSPRTKCIYRDNRSANECVAYAVREGLKGDKWKAIAWLAIGQSHNPSAMQVINSNKKFAFSYLMSHYVAFWVNDDPDEHGGGEAVREGVTLADGGLGHCAGDDNISLIQIPNNGLRVTVCDDETGDPNDGSGCKTFGPGTWGPGDLGILHDDISYVRVWRP
jgi:hypothetical protein